MKAPAPAVEAELVHWLDQCLNGSLHECCCGVYAIRNDGGSIYLSEAAARAILKRLQVAEDRLRSGA